MSEKHTLEPWLYRPDKHDDWGFIRDIEGHCVCVAANSRIGYDQHDEYRRAGKDPYESNARRIIDCVNACAGMDDPAAEIAALKAEIHRLKEWHPIEHAPKDGTVILVKFDPLSEEYTTVRWRETDYQQWWYDYSIGEWDLYISESAVFRYIESKVQP